jgi:uncharacterized protein YcbK (DUF882 family)
VRAETTQAGNPIVARTAQRLALAAVFSVLGAHGLHTAIANGDTRTISLHHTHRGDDISVTFKRNGRYDEEGLKKLNHFLRDWRTDDVTTMDPQLFDAVWEVQREFGLDKPLHIISSYRSPRTNEMLRKRSSGVARHSLHMQGKAMDFFIPGVPLDKVREAGMRLQRGGVGFYPTSGSPFVHMDVGNVRMWPRMTREQLARVFPDGRTVHLPVDGKPLGGFALAQADLAKRRSDPSAFEAARIAAADTESGKTKNLFARMFSGRTAANEDEDSESAAPAAQPAPSAKSKVAAVAARGRDAVLDTVKGRTTGLQASAAVPMPKSRPAAAAAMQVAAIRPAAVQPRPVVAGSFALAAITPNDIISSRGVWQGPQEGQNEILSRARNIEVASADSTASIGPFAAPPGYGEGKPRDGTLAFASPVEPEPAQTAPQRAKPTGVAIPKAAAIAANTTIAAKARPNGQAEVQSAPAMPEASAADAHGEADHRFDGPWMRALMITPSVERFMSTTLYGMQDFRSLQPLLQKPSSMLLMAFAAEPSGLPSHQRFEGRAVEFPVTAQFTPRSSASLR